MEKFDILKSYERIRNQKMISWILKDTFYEKFSETKFGSNIYFMYLTSSENPEQQAVSRLFADWIIFSCFHLLLKFQL